jgi:uncharacterized protein YndB with AHSA1/START domain
MESNNKTTIVKGADNKQLKINREFDGSLQAVWDAWTKSELLDQWWAPRPWKANTKSMDFREGGTWLYAMVGPDGTSAWCRADYQTIVPLASFTGLDAFCDADGNISTDFPRMHWQCEFGKTTNGTVVNVTITFDKEADLEKIIEMGFKEGFTAAHGNLDELLKK